MNREIDNACNECKNKINEYLDGFDKHYQRLQKEIFAYKIEKYNIIVNEVDYSVLYQLRNEISRKLSFLNNEIRKILEKNIK